MRLADGRQHADLRPSQLRQVADLVEAIRCQLQHGQAVVRLELARRDRQPVASVDAAAVVKHRLLAVAEHRRDQLLGRRLASGAGNAYGGQARPLQGVPGIGRQRCARIWHNQAGHPCSSQVDRALAEHRRRAACDCVADEVVAIPLFGLDGHEDRRQRIGRACGSEQPGIVRERQKAAGEDRAVDKAP